MILGLLVGLMVAFVFSGIEAGLLSLNRVRLRRRAAEGIAAARTLQELLAHPARLTVTVALITQVARFASLVLTFQLLSQAVNQHWAFWILVAALPLLALLLEFLPKLLFSRFPYRLLVIFARLLQLCDGILGPLLHWSRHFGFERLMQQRLSRSQSSSAADLTELRQAFNAATDARMITPLQKHFLHSILNARGMRVGEMAQPVEALQPIAPELPVAEALDLAEQRGVERLLVVDEKGVTLGYLRTLDLLLDGIHHGRAQSYLRPLHHLPPETLLLDAIRQLRSWRAPLVRCLRSDGREGILQAEELVRHLFHGPVSNG